MNSFLSTEQRLDVTCSRFPAFPRESAVVVRLIKHIYNQVNDDLNAVLRPHALNHPEYNILMMMYGTPGNAVTPSQLAGAAGEKSANITRLTNGLCDRGFIVRTANEEDRRKVTLALTPAGEALIEAFLPEVCGLLASEMKALGKAEQAELERLLKKMLVGLSG
jgi:MarR family transcriptional regulator, negative regulator of the multidrug operon emrRAB